MAGLEPFSARHRGNSVSKLFILVLLLVSVCSLTISSSSLATETTISRQSVRHDAVGSYLWLSPPYSVVPYTNSALYKPCTENGADCKRDLRPTKRASSGKSGESHSPDSRPLALLRAKAQDATAFHFSAGARRLPSFHLAIVGRVGTQVFQLHSMRQSALSPW